MYGRSLLSSVAALTLIGSAAAGHAATGGSKACCSSALHLSTAQKRPIGRGLTGPEQRPPDFHELVTASLRDR